MKQKTCDKKRFEYAAFIWSTYIATITCSSLNPTIEPTFYPSVNPTLEPIIKHHGWSTGHISTPTAASMTHRMAIGLYENSIFLLGGEIVENLLEYNLETDTFINHGKLTSSNSNWVTVAGYSQYWSQVDHMLYMISWSGEYINAFNLNSKTYTTNYFATTIPIDVNTAGCLVATAQKLYILGSWDLSYLQIYDVSNNAWTTGSNMNETRTQFSCILSETYNRIYSIGGTNSDTIEYISSTDVLTSWQYTKDKLHYKLDGLESVIYNDTIYVLGGSYYGNHKKSVHMIDIASNKVSVMQHELIYWNQYGSPIVANDILFLFGGHRGGMTQLPSDVYCWQYYDFLERMPALSSSCAMSTTMPDIYTTNVTYSHTFLIYPNSIHIISLCITCICVLVSIVIIISFMRYVYIQQRYPRIFYFEHIIAPPSTKLLYSIQIIHTFIVFSKWYFFIAQGLSWISWNNYCNQYDPYLTGGTTSELMEGCRSDDYCYTLTYDSTNGSDDDECNPYPKVEAIMIINILAWFINFCFNFQHYFITSPCVEGKSWEPAMGFNGESLCFLLNNSYARKTWKEGYYNKQFFKISCYTIAIWIVTIVWYFAMTLSFTLIYNGPYTNFVPIYAVIALLVLCILNEFIKYCIYRKHEAVSDVNNDKYILYLLENKVGIELAKLIWIDLANRGRSVETLLNAEKEETTQIQMQKVTTHKKQRRP
eukprot:140100_1